MSFWPGVAGWRIGREFQAWGWATVKRSKDVDAYSQENALNLDPNFSIGYLIHREGDYIGKHTFRLCVGSVGLAKNRLIIQPCMYFNDFFKGVTPGVKGCF